MDKGGKMFFFFFLLLRNPLKRLSDFPALSAALKTGQKQQGKQFSVNQTQAGVNSTFAGDYFQWLNNTHLVVW